jgi:hypothetical protein
VLYVACNVLDNMYNFDIRVFVWSKTKSTWEKMEPLLVTLLWSKYSPHCKNLLDGISTAPIDLTSTIGLQMVCVDNEEVRNRVFSSEKFDITAVPCILVSFQDGVIEKYCGSAAFRWTEEQIRQHSPQPPPMPAPMPAPQPSPQQIRRPPPVEEYSSEEEELPPPPRRRKLKKQKPKKTVTSIDDLESEDEDFSIPRPPVGLRTNAGNYEEIQFPESQDENREATRGVNRSASGGKVDVMAQAMQMQKLRDAEDNSNRPAGMPAHMAN